jgi:hypothetical protein
MAQPFEHMTPFTPEILNQAGAEDNQGTPPATEPTTPVEPSAQATPTEPTVPQEPKPDEFIENFNKRYSTQYKTDDEIKGLFTLSGKVTEYEGKLKDHEKFKTDAEQYKKELEETKTTFVSDLLSKPLIKKAYVAEQLLAKFPDRDPFVLQELAMADVDKMSDLDVLARERKIRSKSSLEDIKAVIRKELGIDPATSPEEWDSVVKTELELKASDARDRIKQLFAGIEQPKVVTKEEREAQQAKYLEDKTKAVIPFREIYKKFDEYQNGDFKFAVPEEYKSGLDAMFDGMFIDGNLEVNDQNLATAEKLKRALFVDEYLPKMLEVKEKEVEARLKAEYDKLLHNDAPINTATATDAGTQTEQPGVSSFLRNPQKDERAKKF